MSQFRLDVDPAGVREAGTRMTRTAGALDAEAARLRALLSDLTACFTGTASTALAAEATHLADQVARSAPMFAAAGRALAALADRYEGAVHQDLVRLNNQWDLAVADHALSRRSMGAEVVARADADAADEALAAEQQRLGRAFATLREDLRLATRTAGAALGRATIVAVPANAVAAYTAGGPIGVLTRMLAVLGLSGWGAFAASLPLTALQHALATRPGPEAGSAALAALLDTARSLGMAPIAYAPILRSYYQALAFEHAGIDPRTWDPSKGAEANKATVLAVYRYYGQLFLDHPELQWAGMANMIGPSFAAGFFDLAAMRDGARRLSEIPGAAVIAGPAFGGLKAFGAAGDGELRFFETTFLGMQRNIFLDQAAMHEAYLHGGIPAIEEMRAANLVDDRTLGGWSKIDAGTRTGNPALIAAGNTDLLYREQYRIIADDYDNMRAHDGLVGQGFTYAMTVVGAPSIPGAHAYGDVFPAHVSIPSPGPERLGTPSRLGTPDHLGPFHIPSIGVDIPHVSVDNPLQVTVDVTTPLPAGNISQRDERWALITKDTLPAYQQLLSNDPALARQIIASPVDHRVDTQRIQHHIDDILQRMTHWSVDVHQ